MTSVTPLDEARDFAACFLAASDPVIDVIALWAAHTHIMQSAFYTTPRLLFWSEMPQAGKTEHESMALRLSLNPWTVNDQTTKDGLRVRFDVSNPGMRPTMGIQEVSDIFGLSGRRGASHPVGTYLRTGYKQGEKTSVSRNGVSVDIGIYHACVMAGLRNAVPADIRSRCIAVQTMPGEPPMYYNGREHDPMAGEIAAGLSAWLRRYTATAERYRLPRGLHPKLAKRNGELWEPMFSVAEIAGGNWPARALAAFREITAEQGSDTRLTARQRYLRDMSGAVRRLDLDPGEMVAGRDLITELRRTGDPMYEPLTDRSLAMFMSQAMAPVRPATLPGQTARGYLVADITAAWETAGITEDDGAADEASTASDEATLFDS